MKYLSLLLAVPLILTACSDSEETETSVNTVETEEETEVEAEEVEDTDETENEDDEEVIFRSGYSEDYEPKGEWVDLTTDDHPTRYIDVVKDEPTDFSQVDYYDEKTPIVEVRHIDEEDAEVMNEEIIRDYLNKNLRIEELYATFRHDSGKEIYYDNPEDYVIEITNNNDTYNTTVNLNMYVPDTFVPSITYTQSEVIFDMIFHDDFSKEVTKLTVDDTVYYQK